MIKGEKFTFGSVKVNKPSLTLVNDGLEVVLGFGFSYKTLL